MITLSNHILKSALNSVPYTFKSPLQLDIITSIYVWPFYSATDSETVRRGATDDKRMVE